MERIYESYFVSDIFSPQIKSINNTLLKLIEYYKASVLYNELESVNLSVNIS